MVGRRRNKGMTMLEVIVVIAVLGLVMGFGFSSFTRSAEDVLYRQTVEAARLLHTAQSMAMESGSLHRVSFDLDKGTAMVEMCEGTVKLEPTSVRERREEKDKLEKIDNLEQFAQSNGVPKGFLQDVAPEKAVVLAAAIANKQLGQSRCVLASGDDRDIEQRGFISQLPQGTQFAKMHLQTHDDPLTEGVGAIHFFPLGYAEKAIVEFSNTNSDRFHLLIHGLSGRIELQAGKPEDPERHLRRNALAGTDGER